MMNINENQKQSLIKVIKVFIVLVFAYLAVLIVGEFKNILSTNNSQVSTISVTGMGEVYAVPDVAELRVNISSEDKDRSVSVSKQAELKQKVLAVLKENSVDEKDYKTEYISTNPKYEWQQQTIYCITYPCPQPSGKQTIVGYTTDELLVVKIRNIDNAGKVYESLVQAGVQNISGPNMIVDNEESFKATARQNAIKDAKIKAKQLTRDLGVRKVKIVGFNENTGGVMPMYASDVRVMKSESAPSTDISTGQNKITSTVTITYEIR